MSLTPRQQEVREMMVRGMTIKKIALEMHISPRTVEDHRKRVMQQYGVRNVVQLLRVAYGISEAAKILEPE